MKDEFLICIMCMSGNYDVYIAWLFAIDRVKSCSHEMGPVGLFFLMCISTFIHEVDLAFF